MACCFCGYSCMHNGLLAVQTIAGTCSDRTGAVQSCLLPSADSTLACRCITDADTLTMQKVRRGCSIGGGQHGSTQRMQPELQLQPDELPPLYVCAPVSRQEAVLLQCPSWHLQGHLVRSNAILARIGMLGRPQLHRLQYFNPHAWYGEQPFIREACTCSQKTTMKHCGVIRCSLSC